MDKPSTISNPEYTAKQGRFKTIGAELGALLAVKNQAYGDSFERGGEILQILYPDGITHDQMPDALAMIRVIDKLFRIATDNAGPAQGEW